MSMTRVVITRLVTILILCAFVLGGCATTSASPSASSTPTSASSTPTPVAAQHIQVASACSLPPPTPSPDSHPQAGDIPDSQVFLTYQSAPGGYQLQVPEGWARTTNAADVSFINKLDGVQVSLTHASTAPTTDSVSTNQAVALEHSGQAVRDICVQDAKLGSRAAVLIVYTSTSDPDPVTGKQLRLENNAYLFFQSGKLATLTLWAPLGADNVDQWARISRSFRWV